MAKLESQPTACPWCRGAKMVPQMDADDVPCPVCKGGGVSDKPVSLGTAEQPVCPGMLIHGSHEITFTYSNWRGEIARRRVGACSIWFGSTEWHPGEQWLLHGIDLDKMEARDFAMKDMWDVRYT